MCEKRETDSKKHAEAEDVLPGSSMLHGSIGITAETDSDHTSEYLGENTPRTDQREEHHFSLPGKSDPTTINLTESRAHDDVTMKDSGRCETEQTLRSLLDVTRALMKLHEEAMNALGGLIEINEQLMDRYRQFINVNRQCMDLNTELMDEYEQLLKENAQWIVKYGQSLEKYRQRWTRTAR